MTTTRTPTAEEQAKTAAVVKDVERAFNEIVRDVFPEFCAREPSYRYFSRRGHPNDSDMYFWTTESVQRGGKPRYASGIYRHLKTKRQWKLTSERYHALRKDAKARALALYKEANP